MSDPTKLRYSDWPPGEALGLRRLAHDLMTPITVLMGNLQLFMMRKDLPTPVSAKVEDLYKQTQNLMRMIQEAQKHAYDTAWTGESGPIWERWVEGNEVASSSLTRNGASIIITDPKCSAVWVGEPEAWSEWFGSFFAMISNKLERSGKIELSSHGNGWSVKASPVNSETENFTEWKELLTGESEAPHLTGYRRYRELLFLNECTPVAVLKDKVLTMEFVKKGE